ncbi:hypothetical protein GCM10011351_05870 [Paraliobacillus quinghaiensis]|uniref:Heptaprenyl diphosphate synthase n=1 Tax=Paraliobacillus quinghaiensis TaxID=470815 RepID=A0A917WR74_9BACI|nr:heptaprenyl diphosphate synthase component 1 [Paraliobacillus quinghaiensis]GGM22835.1 hypothetical protein GCM10011351_05870 [Paraliobacillus quinghaiensis]
MSGLTIKGIQEELENILQHSYLKKSIPKPVIDKDKLLILYTLVKNTSYSNLKKKNYIITTMLVQIALDTHDLVTENTKDESESIKENRQLTVLAGDYYSGLYYYMLAKLDDISMIHTLASAIKEINELKMEIYYDTYESVTAFIEALKKLESKLITRVAEHFNRSSIDEFAQNWLLTKRLIHEKGLFISNQQAPLFDLLTDGPAHNIKYNQVIPTVESIIGNHLLILDELAQVLPTHYQLLKNYVQNFYADSVNQTRIVMEEG